MTKKNIAIVEMIVCSVLWSIAGVLIKGIQCHPMVITGLRSFVAALTVAGFMVVSKIRFKLTFEALISAICLCCTVSAFVMANKMTTAANAIVLQYVSPIFVLLFSVIFFKKRFSKADILVSVVTLAGISLFFFDEMDRGGVTGNIVAVISGIFIAAMFVFNGSCGKDERMTGVFLGQCFAAIAGMCFIPFTDNVFDFTGVSSIIILGVFQLGIPYILVALALEHCPPLACTLISVIEPLLNPVWVFIFKKEVPGPNAFVGAAIILISVTSWCIYNDTKEKKKLSS